MLFQTSLFQTWFWTDLFFSFLQRHVGLWFWWENWSKLRSRQTLHLGLVWTRPQTVAGHEESQFYGSCQELLPRKTKTKLQLLLVSVNLAPAVETVGGCLRSERMFQKHFWNSNIHSVKKKNKQQSKTMRRLFRFLSSQLTGSHSELESGNIWCHTDSMTVNSPLASGQLCSLCFCQLQNELQNPTGNNTNV